MNLQIVPGLSFSLRIAIGWSITATLVWNSLARGESAIDFQKQIQPIFIAHCVKCHGEAKSAAKMRLDSVEGLRKKLEADAELIVAGVPEKSALYQRLVLPASDSKRMPKGSDPLSKESIELIAAWIKQGAALPTSGASNPIASASPDEAAPASAVETASEPPLPKVPPPPQAAIDRLSAAGAQVSPLFADCPLLQISFAHRGSPASDADVALLQDVAEQVYELDLSGSKVTASGWAVLAKLKNLANLHLEHSTFSDDAAVHLSELKNLEYLNLYATGVTDVGIKQLADLKKLKKLYLWQTKVSFDEAMGLQKDTPSLMLDLGFDNPSVVRQRLKKELEQLDKQVTDAKTAVDKATKQLEEAKSNVKLFDDRHAELEKQLMQLDQPADGAVADQKGVSSGEVNTPSKKE